MWSAALMLAVVSGRFSTEQIGAVTWGPTSDIRAMAIAISNLEFGLKGGLAYRAVVQSLADTITSKKSDIDVNDERTRELTSNPAVVSKAIRAAAATPRDQIEPDYLHELAEDDGYSDFYKIAFQIFGYDAYSTRALYLTILGLSWAIFVLVYFRENIALAALALDSSAMFLLTSCPALFSSGMPSLAANRFLWTLALIPFLHILIGILISRPLKYSELAAILAQILLGLVAIRARLTGEWCIIAILVTGIFIIARNGRQWRRSLRCGTVLAMVMIAAIAVKEAENATLDSSYFTDDYLPHHLVWHSAFLGLSLHPEWPKHKPYPELPDALSDTIAFASFEHVMKAKGLPFVSSEGLHKFRLHDEIIKQVFTQFALDNPRYMAELYLWYKPMYLVMTFQYVWTASASILGLLVFAVTVGICSLLFKGGLSGYIRGSLLAVPILFACSLLPGEWAYAVIDQAWSSLFVAQAIIAAASAMTIAKRAVQVSPVATTGVSVEKTRST